MLTLQINCGHASMETRHNKINPTGIAFYQREELVKLVNIYDFLFLRVGEGFKMPTELLSRLDFHFK